MFFSKNVSKGLKGVMSYINIMESISENLPKKKCSSCGCLRETEEFEKCGPGACFKTCLKCRENKKRSRANKANSKTSKGSNPESEPSSSSTCRDHWLDDGWAKMTAELLEPMTYDERCAIHICQTTAVSRLNIFFSVKRFINIVVATPPYLLRKLGLCQLERLWAPRLLRFIYQTEVLTSL